MGSLICISMNWPLVHRINFTKPLPCKLENHFTIFCSKKNVNATQFVIWAHWKLWTCFGTKDTLILTRESSGYELEFHAYFKGWIAKKDQDIEMQLLYYVRTWNLLIEKCIFWKLWPWSNLKCVNLKNNTRLFIRFPQVGMDETEKTIFLQVLYSSLCTETIFLKK